MTNSTTIPDSKRCYRCKEIKSLDMFHCDKWRKDGLRAWCVACSSPPKLVKEKQTLEMKRALKRAYSQLWYKKNAEKASFLARAWSKANPEYNKEKCRRRYRENPDKVKAYGQVRRTRIADNGGYFTDKDVAHMRYIQQGHCCYCGRLGQPERIDHIHPVKYGGPSDPWNLALCCPTCNSSKGAKTLEQWTDRWYLLNL